MRVAFAGTPEFAARALAAIVHAGHHVPLVLTQPDRPAGRGMKLHPSTVKQCAQRHGLTLDQPASLRDEASREALSAVHPEVLVVAAYGLILPQAVLDLPRYGCLNIHASLLPRWRGAAPIQRAIAAGDSRTGITIMQMDAGLDTGPMLLQSALAISATETGQTLHDKLADLGAKLIVEALAKLEAGHLPATPQPAEGVTYAAKLSKQEAELDFRLSATELERRIRAFDPFPGAFARFGDVSLKLWGARVEATCSGTPGQILAAGPGGITVACGEGALNLLILQKPGGKRLEAREFLAGFPLEAGARFLLPGD